MSVKETNSTDTSSDIRTMVWGKRSCRRILLKVSGEVLAPNVKYGLHVPTLQFFAEQVVAIHAMGIEIAIVVGGGNLIRGTSIAVDGIDRVTADYMGMMATVINGLALQDLIESRGVTTRLQTAIEMKSIAEPFIRRKAVRHLEKKRVIILAGGTGNPYFTTDTTASLRAVELNADAIFKSTKVDGVYDADPMKTKNARQFSYISFTEAMERELAIMDTTALTLCRENHMPVFVCNMFKEKELENILGGGSMGTLLYSEKGLQYHGHTGFNK